MAIRKVRALDRHSLMIGPHKSDPYSTARRWYKFLRISRMHTKAERLITLLHVHLFEGK